MQKHGTLRLSAVFPPDHPGPVQNVQVPTKCGRQGVPGWTSMKSKFGMTKSNRAALPCLQAPPRPLSTEFLALNSAKLLHQSEADFLVPDKLPFASIKDTQIQSFVPAG